MAVNQDHATLPKTPFSYTCILTTAETAFQLPTNAVVLMPVADNVAGARVTKVYGIPRAAIGTANNIQLYKLVGSTYTLIDSALMATVTPGASVASPKTDFGISPTSPLELKAGEGLAMACGLGVVNGIIGRCEGGFYEA